LRSSQTNTVELDRRLPNSELVVYPDAGHGGVFQFHDDFVKRTLEFLREDERT
jgi:pimeloyl-ACP methyl ester carboxylesterase